MKRLLLTVATIMMTALTAAAQHTLTVTDGSVHWHYDVAALSDTHMPFGNGGGSVTIGAHAYTLGPSVTMSIGSVDFAPLTVTVSYENGGAVVHAPGSLAGLLTISVSGQTVDIAAAPTLDQEVTYVLTGQGESFTLHGEFKSTVVLSDVSLKATGTRPALWIDNGKRIELQVKGKNSFADVPGNEKKAALYVKGHAEWKGDGTVSVAGAQRHAYASGEYTQFKKSFTGTFNVTSAGSDGMHVEQYLEVNGGTFNIAGNKGDGIDVSYAYADEAETIPADEEQNGQFIMNGGTINVAATTAATKGLKSDDKMTINAGRINATAEGDGSRGVSAGTDLYLGIEGATDAKAAYVYLTANGDEYTDPATGDVDKCRGLKVKRDFYHYPSTLERDAESLVTKKKVVDVDGTYHALGGTLVGITIQ